MNEKIIRDHRGFVIESQEKHEHHEERDTLAEQS
jgi:hypothetical protein